MHYLLLAFTALLLLSGCGTTSALKSVNVSKFSTQLPTTTLFIFKDDRPQTEKISRTDASPNGTTVFFGDDSINPPLPDLFKKSLQSGLQGRLSGRTVSLKEFTFYVYDPAAKVDANQLNVAAATVRGGYALAPFAGLLVGGINSLVSEKTVRVVINGMIDGVDFSTNIADRYSGSLSEKELEATLLKALAQVSSEIEHTARGK